MLFLAGLMRGVFFSAVWRSMRRNWLEMRESRTKKLSGYDVVRVLSSHRAQRPPGSLAGRPVGWTAGICRFHSSLEQLTNSVRSSSKQRKPRTFFSLGHERIQREGGN